MSVIFIIVGFFLLMAFLNQPPGADPEGPTTALFLGIIFSTFGFFLLFKTSKSTIDINRETSEIIIKISNITNETVKPFSFAEIDHVELARFPSGDTPVYRVEFKLVSGESFPLSNLYTSDYEDQITLVNYINQFLNKTSVENIKDTESQISENEQVQAHDSPGMIVREACKEQESNYTSVTQSTSDETFKELDSINNYSDDLEIFIPDSNGFILKYRPLMIWIVGGVLFSLVGLLLMINGISSKDSVINLLGFMYLLAGLAAFIFPESYYCYYDKTRKRITIVAKSLYQNKIAVFKISEVTKAFIAGGQKLYGGERQAYYLSLLTKSGKEFQASTYFFFRYRLRKSVQKVNNFLASINGINKIETLKAETKDFENCSVSLNDSESIGEAIYNVQESEIDEQKIPDNFIETAKKFKIKPVTKNSKQKRPLKDKIDNEIKPEIDRLGSKNLLLMFLMSGGTGCVMGVVLAIFCFLISIPSSPFARMGCLCYWVFFVVGPVALSWLRYRAMFISKIEALFIGAFSGFSAGFVASILVCMYDIIFNNTAILTDYSGSLNSKTGLFIVVLIFSILFGFFVALINAITTVIFKNKLSFG